MMDMHDKMHGVQGFTASAAAAGLKKEEAMDLALIVSEEPATAAGVFTTNRVKAAPVVLSQEHLRAGTARAIVVNSGCANACTGPAGLHDARQTADLVARALGIEAREVLVASTGVIGQRLNMAGISGALPGLVQGLSPAGLEMAAQAIMTTDAFPKISSREGGVGGHPYRILGIAKGAGMIMPNMATMLAFLLTDLRIEVDPLNQIIRTAAEATFNRITVDGDTSTNDTVMVMANSRAGNGALNQKELKDVAHGFQAVMGELAEMMVRDGEGASKVVHVAVRGGHRAADALEGARTVANSTLVKTAFYGQDPNWGRIMAALGRADIHMDPEAVDIWIDDVLIVTNGLGTGAEAERAAAQRMARSAFTLTIDLHQGPYADQMVTCDLTHDYIKINADYRT